MIKFHLTPLFRARSVWCHKDNGKDCRLIFHLSYPWNSTKPRSVNANTPSSKCKVTYCDFNMAIKRSIEEGRNCKMSKSDMKLAFRNLRIKILHWKFLVMKAKDPETGKFKFFVDKCLPFGASISCAHFQAVSDAVAHLVKWRMGKVVINYLDDYLFIAFLAMFCKNQLTEFLKICTLLNFPIALDKTFWATTRMVFLGLLIDMEFQLVLIPKEKLLKGQYLVELILERKSKKATVKELQQLCGFLNFLGRAIVPGRAFTHRLNAYTKGTLKPHHHIRITQEIRLDLEMWKSFLHHPSIFARPFLDFTKTAVTIPMYSDASKNLKLGFGATCETHWCYSQWNIDFILQRNPSIEYLELYALVVAVVLLINSYKNQ